MNVKVIATTQPLDGDPQQLIEYAGRVCTNSLSRVGQNTEKFIRERVKEQHLGLLEHNSITFLVEGISRVCSHQLVRSRVASYAQTSERYCDASALGFVIPESIRADADTLEAYTKILTGLFVFYSTMRRAGIPKEDARFALPQATKTNILVTMNLRSYLHLFDMRIHPAAQWEIREMCMHMLDALLFYAPAVFIPYREALVEKYPDLFKENSNGM